MKRTYRYQAIDRAGHPQMGTVQADNPLEAQRLLQAHGYLVQQLVEVRVPTSQQASAAIATPSAPTPSPALWESAQVNDRVLGLFFAQIASFLKAGYTPADAFQHLSRRVHDERLQKACVELSRVAQRGGRISEGMAQFPHLFPAFAIGAIRAAEMGGYLPDAANQLADYFAERWRRRLWFWMPRLLLINGVIIVPLLAPISAAFLDGLKLYSQSPNLTPVGAILQAWGLLVLRYGVPFWLLVLLLWLIWHLLMRSARLERWRSAVSLVVPYLWGYSDWIRARALQVFVEHLMRLMNAAIMPGTAWELAAHAVPNRVIAEGLLQVKFGYGDRPEPVDAAIARTGLFPPEEVALLSTGVQTGDVVGMLSRLAQMYEARCEQAARLYRFSIVRFALLIVLLTLGANCIGYTYGAYGNIFQFVEEWVGTP
ncbi:MAG: type II secretion system F family protein [Fimbriimonadales bacterium]|nr:type II secretion system F family protein [Fimbriimonadales bacterium]